MRTQLMFLMVLMATLASAQSFAGKTVGDPTMLFTVDGQTHISARPNQTVTYHWSSSNVVSVESFYFADRADACNGGYDIGRAARHAALPWVAITPSQTQDLAAAVQPCQAGVSYTIVLVGHDINGQPVTSQVIVVDVPKN